MFYVLIILDGFGYCIEIEFNVIVYVSILNWDKFWSECLYILILGFGMDVGLFDGQMGNFEVGYMNLGVGCIVYQDFICIIKVICDGDFFINFILVEVVDKCVSNDFVLYLIGLLLFGGVYSYEDYFVVMVELVVK